MAKYTEEDYVSKLLPESLAQLILDDDLKASEYMDMLHQLWEDSRDYLMEQRSEKEFILSVMQQVDYYSNLEDYHNDLEAINENALSEDGKLQLAENNMGMYYNYYISRLYYIIKDGGFVSVRDLFSFILFQRRTKLALWYVNTVCQNFGIEITQDDKPVDLKAAKFDSTVEIKRVCNK